MELEGENISRRYLRRAEDKNVFTALKETDIKLTGGELTVLLGRSGSGKSTLLNILSGLLRPDTGRVLLNGQDIYELDDERRSRLRNDEMGIIPQGQTGLHSLTVLENILLPIRMYGQEVPMEFAGELTKSLGIDMLLNVYPNELSGGEMRRLAIARALVKSPGIVLADEPTGDLDDESTKAVLSLLRKTADRGAAVLLVTHEEEAADYADRVFRMDGGVMKAV